MISGEMRRYGTKQEPGIAPNTFNEIFKAKERDKNRMHYTLKASPANIVARASLKNVHRPSSIDRVALNCHDSIDSEYARDSV